MAELATRAREGQLAAEARFAALEARLAALEAKSAPEAIALPDHTPPEAPGD
jgi:BMFP domain-containing protein YqiC